MLCLKNYKHFPKNTFFQNQYCYICYYKIFSNFNLSKMEKIIIEGQVHLPNIVLDKEQNRFEFSGQSMPEDVIAFYTPILKWFDEYILNPNDTTEFEMKLVYFNTASSKMIYEVINRLDKLYKNNNKAKVVWHYAEDDEDIEATGRKLEKIFSVPFDFKSYQD